MKHLWTLYQAEVRPLLQKYCVSWRDGTLWQADKFLAQHGYLQGSPTVEPRPGKWQFDGQGTIGSQLIAVASAGRAELESR